MMNRALRLRNGTIKLAMQSKVQLRRANKLEELRVQRLRGLLMKKELDKANRQRIIEVLKLDSTNWFTQKNIDNKLLKDTLIPDVVTSHTDYYKNLQNLALANEISDYDQMEDLVFENRAIKYKNSKLVPLYSRIKGLIKFMKKSPERSLLADYEVARAHLEDKFRGKELDQKLKKMQSIYENLLVQIRKESQEAPRLIKDLSEKFLVFYNILSLWKNYTEIVRKSATELQVEMESDLGFEEDVEVNTMGDKMDYTSPDEKMTEQEDEPDEALDFEKMKLMMKKDMRELEEESMRRFKQTIEKKKSEKITPEPQAIESPEIDGQDPNKPLLDDVEEINAKAEDEWAKSGIDPGMYGLSSNAKLTKAKDFLLKTNIEKLFPKELLEDAFKFEKPYLETSSIADIKARHEAFKNSDPSSLNGSIFVDTLRARLESIDKSKLSSKDKAALDDLVFLLERIGEMKIPEARLLSRVFDLM